MQTTDFVATVFDGTSNPNKVTVTFTMALNALLKGHTATIILMVEAVELADPHVGMPRHAHHAPEVGVLLVAPQHLPLAVARKDQHRAAVGAHVAQRRHVVHQRLRIG